MWRIIAVCVLIALSGGCKKPGVEQLVRTGPHATEQEVIDEVFGNASNLGLVKTADAVVACRLRHDEAGSRPIAPAEYEAGPPVALSEKQANRVRAVVTDRRYYYFDGAAKACGHPIFGVRLRFERDGETVDLNLCFLCNDMAVTQDSKDVGWADFSRARPELVALCKALFPNDAEIQRLESNR